MWEEESLNELISASCRGKDNTTPVFIAQESLL